MLLLDTFLYILWAIGVPLGIAAAVWWLLKARDRLRLTWNAWCHQQNLAKWTRICQEYYVVGQIYMPVGNAIMTWDAAKVSHDNYHYLAEERCIVYPEDALLLLNVEVCEHRKDMYYSSKWDPLTTMIRWEFFCDEKKMRFEITTIRSPSMSTWKTGDLPYHLPFITPGDMAIHEEMLVGGETHKHGNFFHRMHQKPWKQRMRYVHA